jgi:hypothetical protein
MGALRSKFAFFPPLNSFSTDFQTLPSLQPSKTGVALGYHDNLPSSSTSLLGVVRDELLELSSLSLKRDGRIRKK